MRSAFRVAALILVVLALLLPMAAYAADGGPCPDDWEAFEDCDSEAPPYYIVVNRAVELTDRPGTGCLPIILNHPGCTDCATGDCALIDVEAEVCQPLLAGKVAAGDTEIVYEMCCACAVDPDGEWMFRIRNLDSAGNCPIDLDNPDWISGLPAGTGIDLPAPVIVGGLALAGLGLLAAGVGLRRRATRVAG